jgi:hypothetical protein
MSSVSSYDSYHISLENYDESYIKKLDELESGSASCSDSCSDNENVEYKKITFKEAKRQLLKTKIEENELAIICLYLKCKRNVFNLADQTSKMHEKMLFIPSLLLSCSLVVLPYFSVNKFVSSSIGFALMSCICLFKYYNFETESKYYKSISNKYGKLHSNVETFLAKLVYVSDRQHVYYEKTREIENHLYRFKEEENIKIPYSIRLLVPVISNIEIFHSIHNVEIDQNHLITRYKNVKNEIEKINSKLKIEDKPASSLENRLMFLFDNKKKIKEKLQMTNYSKIKEELEKEYRTHLMKYD